MKKKGLRPSFENGLKRASAYNTAYGLDDFGYPSNQSSFYSASMPTAVAVPLPLCWQPRVALP